MAPRPAESIAGIAADANCHGIIKSKSMASEEIELTHHLENAGMDVVETDLGEFIIQISDDKPSHLVAPIIHKESCVDRAGCSRIISTRPTATIRQRSPARRASICATNSAGPIWALQAGTS